VTTAAGDAPIKIRLSHLTKRFRTKAVGLFMIALLGFLFTHLLNALERWVVPWKSR
jgi:ABC-type nitrate/sulfonate/bicarbonate transport system permease component